MPTNDFLQKISDAIKRASEKQVEKISLADAFNESVELNKAESKAREAIASWREDLQKRCPHELAIHFAGYSRTYKCRACGLEKVSIGA